MAFKCFQYTTSADFEYLSSGIFWTLGSLIILNGYWINQQVEQFSELEKQQSNPQSSDASESAEKTSSQASSSSANSPTLPSSGHYHLFWLQPHITSHLRRFLAILLCSLVLPLQFLQGSWVLRTAWRLTSATIRATYPSTKPFLIRYCLYIPVSVVVLAAWAGIVMAGLFLVFGQLTYVLQLCELRPQSPLVSKKALKIIKEREERERLVEKEQEKEDEGTSSG
ncbi:hypothetical protein NM208_g13578 [Fusarium decemcellulare]|uniref:Uncharacterized protein n=1 Tax=Fusarium decemcellulare TaxID=57161 RepID=A0ACC1RJD2_9HYPO|nr:hypothetical protein NM208_g13578 [Fusarium decemcellulare]